MIGSSLFDVLYLIAPVRLMGWIVECIHIYICHVYVYVYMCICTVCCGIGDSGLREFPSVQVCVYPDGSRITRTSKELAALDSSPSRS